MPSGRIRSASLMQATMRRLSGSAAVYHQPPSKVSIRRPIPSSGASSNSMTLPASRVAGFQPHALPTRDDAAAPGRIDDETGGMPRAITQAHPPTGWFAHQTIDIGRDQRGARRCCRPHHRIEARAIEMPADLLDLEQEFVAHELWAAPGAHRAVGGTVPVRFKCRPQPQMCEQRLDLRRHGLADPQVIHRSNVGDADPQLRCEIRQRQRGRSPRGAGTRDQDIEIRQTFSSPVSQTRSPPRRLD